MGSPAIAFICGQLLRRKARRISALSGLLIKCVLNKKGLQKTKSQTYFSMNRSLYLGSGFYQAFINIRKSGSSSPDCGENPVVPGFGTTDWNGKREMP
jgi:hypothetical protein